MKLWIEKNSREESIKYKKKMLAVLCFPLQFLLFSQNYPFIQSMYLAINAHHIDKNKIKPAYLNFTYRVTLRFTLLVE